MNGVLFCLLCLTPLFQGGTAKTAVGPDDFRGWFLAASEHKLDIPKSIEENARRYRYVFIAGFSNERMPGYFAQNAKELRALGVPRKAIHYVYPSSSKTVEENLDEVHSKIVEIAGKGPERLVVIAHSRGACDAMAFALHHKEFVEEHIQALFLVQGPFGGTGVADFVTGEGPPMDCRMPWRYRMLGKLVGGMEKLLLKRGRHGGLTGMSRWVSRDYWTRSLEEHADAIPIVGPRTFYVTSETTPSHLRFFKKATGAYLSAYFGPNDGMVSPDDQSLTGVGTVLAVLDAGHSDLTNRFPAARADRNLRRALIQGIVMAVGHEMPACQAPEPSTETAP
ncbi:MAG: hypothetical protein JWN86_2877 [Planctomycetota bacterium]|nr:hypothetical protein [Planctomycetota bacterium]